MEINQLILTAIPNIPHIQPQANLAAVLIAALDAANLPLQDGDVLAIAQKIVSKAEGRQVNLAEVEPSARALEVGAAVEKDPRLIELILRESTDISRMRQGVIIVRHRLGFTSANAGIDRSNVPQAAEGETVLLLPEDPDATAADLRAKLGAAFGADIGVIITDSHGRPFRVGTVGVAIGVAGIPAVLDKRGSEDLFGYQLRATEIGIADEMAAAASLLMGQAAEGTPVVLLRGLELPPAAGKASDLVRPKVFDLYT